LRENGITRIEIGETHFRVSETGYRKDGRDYLFPPGIRFPKSEIKRTARLCPDPSRNRGPGNQRCWA
jgi:hypothetical protein